MSTMSSNLNSQNKMIAVTATTTTTTAAAAATVIANEKVNVSGNDFLKFAIVPYKELEKLAKLQWIMSTYSPKMDLEPTLASAVMSFQLDINEEYAFIMTERSGAPFPRYITEENRHIIKNGDLLQLYYSPKSFVAKLVEKTQLVTPEELLPLLCEISEHSLDPAFVVEFDIQKGFKWLLNGIQSGHFAKDEQLCTALEIFLRVLDHDIVHWSSIEKQLIESVAQNLYNQNDINQFKEVEHKILITSLSILESAVINCPGKFASEVEKQISLPNLYNLLKNDSQIQQNVLALINAILSRTDATKRRAMAATLSSRQFKDTILQYIVNRKNQSENDKSSACGSEISHQLYVLQTLLLHYYGDRLNSDATLEEAREKVLDIRNHYLITMERDGFENKAATMFRSQTSLASNSSSSSVSSENYAEDFERLGFPNATNPWESFYEPPGAFVLDLLHYFSKTHTDTFVRFVIENSSPGDRQYDCPLVIASFRLTNLLCELLGVGKPPRDEGKEFYAMLFDTDKPLEEFFSIGLSLFNRTWHEIHATSTDIDIVCDFLHEKLRKTLANVDATNSFESFRKELSKITYAEINRRWTEERDKRDRQKEELTVIKELKTLLKPEMLSLVRQHRLNYLIRGTRFDKYTSKGQRIKDKFWYCRLSSNHKTLLYGDCDEDYKNLDDILVNKFNIADIDQLSVGKECPHMRDAKGKKSTTSLAFALISRDDSQRNLCFVAPTAEVFDYWVDGLNALMERTMTSQEATKDADMLLELDIKLRLLDIEGLSIPEKAPELPPSPPNYDFNFKPTLIQ